MGISGMNKRRSQKLVFVVLLSAYLVVAAVFVVQLFNLPSVYSRMGKAKITAVQQSLEMTLNSTMTENERAVALKEIVKKYPMELIVSNSKGIVFSTFEKIEINSIRTLFHEDAVLYKSQGQIETANGVYTVLYSVYQVTAIEYIQQQFFYLTVLVLVLILLIIVAMSAMYYILLRPLEKLKIGIANLSDYQFGELIEDDNVISSEFNRFTHKMNEKIQKVSRNYTELELALEFERERLLIMMTISRAFVHDLKTPVHQTLLENEFVMSQMETPSKELQVLADFNVERADKLLKEINEILVLMDTENDEIEKKIEAFDFIPIFEETWKLFRFFITNNQLSFFSDLPKNLNVQMNKVSAKIIIHNLLSNATKYAKADSEIVFEIETGSQDYFEIICKNETTLENIQRMRNSEQLFNAIENEGGYSSGNGLYLLRELSEFIGGSYQFSIEDENVVIRIRLPYNQDYKGRDKA